MSWHKGGGTSFGGSIQALTIEQTDFKAEAGKKATSRISAKLVIDKDGADEPLTQFLDMGFINPERGQSVVDETVLAGGAHVSTGSEFQRFVQGAIDAGFDEALIGDGTDFSALVGKRYEFGYAINRDKQIAAGLKALGSKDLKQEPKDGVYVGKLGKTHTEAEVMEAGKRVAKDGPKKGQKFNHTFLVITDVLGDAPVAAAPAKKSAAGKKSAAAVKGQPNGKAAETDYEVADALLITALSEAKNNTLKRSSLNSVVVKWAVAEDKSNEERDAVRELFASDEYLARTAGWKVNGDGKDQTVSL